MHICANIQLLYEHLSLIEQEQRYIRDLRLELHRLGTLASLNPAFDSELYLEMQSRAERLEDAISDRRSLVQMMCEELLASKKYIEREIDEAETAVQKLFWE